jgi:hypothetical protein
MLRLRRHPIKANPVKTGDAKPWVFDHTQVVDHDCQAAEDHKSKFVSIRPGFNQPGFFVGCLQGWDLHGLSLDIPASQEAILRMYRP